ncbi:MAG: hypothetical protein U9N34_03720 [Candidatus Cloacimonadota bacterium]|nr:hypothetical protein [Candidatus Cloacimonadota bacterium]
MEREKIYKELKIDESDKFTHIVIKIYYDKGGMNYFSTREERRGLYLSVTPIKREGHWTSYRGFSGTKMLVKPMKRYSRKQLDNFEPNQEDIDRILENVLNKNNLTTKEVA